MVAEGDEPSDLSLDADATRGHVSLRKEPSGVVSAAIKRQPLRPLKAREPLRAKPLHAKLMSDPAVEREFRLV